MSACVGKNGGSYETHSRYGFQQPHEAAGQDQTYIFSGFCLGLERLA